MINVNCNDSPVQIYIYDISCHLVHSDVTDTHGDYSWDAREVPSGAYLVRVELDAGHLDRKVLLLR